MLFAPGSYRRNSAPPSGKTSERWSDFFLTRRSAGSGNPKTSSAWRFILPATPAVIVPAPSSRLTVGTRSNLVDDLGRAGVSYVMSAFSDPTSAIGPPQGVSATSWCLHHAARAVEAD